MRKNIVTKLLTLVLVLANILIFSGCSAFMDDYSLRHVTEYANNVIKEMNTDFYLASSKYCKNQVWIPEFTEEREDLFNEALNKVKFELDSISVNSSRKKAVCKVVLNYIDFGAIAKKNPSATEEVYRDAINSADITSVVVKLTILIDGRDYIFDDFSPINDLLKLGYENVEILDNNGMPVALDYDFILSLYQGSCWFDSFRSNPMTDLCTDYLGGMNDMVMEKPQTLRVAFYFISPITVDFTVELYKGDSLVSSYDAKMNSDVVLIADFSKFDIGNNDFEPGEYRIDLKFSDYKLISSESIKVS